MAKRLLLLAFLSVAVLLLLSCMVVKEQEDAPAVALKNEELFYVSNVSVIINREPDTFLINAFAFFCIIYCAIAAAYKQPVVDANGRVICCKAYYRCAYESFLINERAG